MPLANPAYHRAIHYFAHSHDLSGGGQVAWFADCDLTPELRAALGIDADASGVDLEVLASRLPKVLAELSELYVPVAYAVLPNDEATITASLPILKSFGIATLRTAPVAA